MPTTAHNKERRNAQRFAVSWDVLIKGTDQSGESFDELGTLENLSSLGAFLYVSHQVSVGEILEVQIKVPFKANNWMKYNAEVVRLESGGGQSGIGLRFDTPVPVFVPRLSLN